jgi:hypothetical protein
VKDRNGYCVAWSDHLAGVKAIEGTTAHVGIRGLKLRILILRTGPGVRVGGQGFETLAQCGTPSTLPS